MQIPGLMCAMKAADANVTDALVAVSRVARQLDADAVQPVLFGNACERCAVEDRHLDHGVTCGLPGNLRRQAATTRWQPGQRRALVIRRRRPDFGPHAIPPASPAK